MLEVKKVFEKVDLEDNSIFYRYEIGDYEVWFSQHLDNGKPEKRQNCVGCIFIVHIVVNNNCKQNGRLALQISEKSLTNGYPDTFKIGYLPQTCDLDNIDNLMEQVSYAKTVLQKIKDLFYSNNYEHYENFCKRLELR